MSNREEEGRVLLLEVIGILFIVETITFFIERDAVALFILVLNVFLWIFMYKGFVLVKFITIVSLFVGAIISIVFIVTSTASSGPTFWWIILFIVYLSTSLILLFSKKISEYMEYKREFA